MYTKERANAVNVLNLNINILETVKGQEELLSRYIRERQKKIWKE